MAGSFTGAYKPGVSIESKGLSDLDASKQSFANRDFVKNIAWLNQSVTTLGEYTQKLQAGVDAAGGDIFDTINDLLAEIAILFAGGSATGFDFGDLQYIFQAWGAMFGINPGTPFPLNLLEAVEYMFTNYMVPSEQFTDVIFDSINSWAEYYGLSPEFLESIGDLQQAIDDLNDAMSADFLNSLHDLIEALGFQDPAAKAFWEEVGSWFGISEGWDIKPSIRMIADWTIPFIEGLADIVNNINAFLHPADVISASQIQILSANIAPPPSNNTVTWGVGSNDIYAWKYDEPTQSFTTQGGSGTNKRILMERMATAIPGQTVVCDMQVDWAGISSNQVGFGFIIVFYNGNTEKVFQTIKVPTGHSANGTAVALHGEFTVPSDCDGMKVGAFMDNTVTAGRVYAKAISAKVSGQMRINQIFELQDQLNNLMPWDVWFDALQVPSTNQQAVTDWINSVLTADSWISSLQLLGTIPGNLIDWVPIGSLYQGNTNYIVDPNFENGANIDGRGIWVYDATVGYNDFGSVRCSGEGVTKALLSKSKIATQKNNQITLGGYVKWQGLAVSGASGAKIALDLLIFNGNKVIDTVRVAHIDTPGTNSAFTYIGATYTVTQDDATHFRMRLVVTDQVTSGLVWFDNVLGQKTQLIALDWVDGATEWLTELGDNFDHWLQDTLTAINGFFDPGGNTTAWINDLVESMNDWWGDTQDALANAQNAWDNSELGKAWASAVNTYTTNVNNWNAAAQVWLKNLFEDGTILLDLFHTTYPVGHSTDAPDHTELYKGKTLRTYWAAWNRQMQGVQWSQTPATAPTAPVLASIVVPGTGAGSGSAPTLPADPSPAAQVSAKFNTVNAAIKAGADGSDPLGADVSDQDVTDAIASLRDTVSDLQSTVDGIVATPTSGLSYTAKGQATASDWNPFVLTGNTAAAKRTPVGFLWDKSGSSDRMVLARFPSALSTNMTMSAIYLGGAVSFDGFQGYLESGSNIVFLRSNAAMTDMIYARIWGKAAKLFAKVAGVDTELDSNTGVGATSQGKLSIYESGNTFTVFWGGEQILQATSTLVAADASHRYNGFGEASRGSTTWNSEWVPATVTQVEARDAAPPIVKGSGLIMLGDSGIGQVGPPTTGITFPNVVTIPRMAYPASPKYQSSDILINAYTTNKDNPLTVTVQDEDWYEVGNYIYFRHPSNAGYALAAILHTDSAQLNPQWYMSGWTTNLALAGSPGPGGYGAQAFLVKTVYCKAGDLLIPAMSYQASTSTIVSDAQWVSFTVTRAGKKT